MEQNPYVRCECEAIHGEGSRMHSEEMCGHVASETLRTHFGTYQMCPACASALRTNMPEAIIKERS